MGSLSKTLNALIEDSVSESASCKFITKNMSSSSMDVEFDKKYEMKRENIRSEFFRSGNLTIMRTREYFIKKFQVLDILVSEMTKI
jgi:hypothetical protein